MKRRLRIAYFEIYHGGDHYEDYAEFPKKWGGGAIFARQAKKLWNNPDREFWVMGSKRCFENFQDWEKTPRCCVLSDEMNHAILRGANIKSLIHDIDYFDVIMHHHTNFAINNRGCRPIQVHWAGFGHASNGHGFVPYTLCYGKNEIASYPGQTVLPVSIGKPVPKEFRAKNKKDFIFQCTRHEDGRGSIEVAQECIKNKIKCYFAGPICKGYDLLNYIDYENTFYLGQISEEVKLKFSEEARLSTYFYSSTGAVFNQSAIECLAAGTPLFVNKVKWFDELVKHGKNGFFYDGTNFAECWEKSKNIDQKECWESAKEFSAEKMMESFDNAISWIVLKEAERLKLNVDIIQ